MNDFLNDLNEKQREAAITVDGPVLIIAGAGSGKTKTLTYRIANLIRGGIGGESILAITFTNKAAEEMKKRIEALLQNIFGATSGRFGPFIGTFHSFCNRILRAHGHYLGFTSSFSIFDEDDSLSLIKEIQKGLGLNPKQFPASVIMHSISRLKSELTDEKAYQEIAEEDFFPKTISRAYTEYQKRLFRANAMDFDDLITKVVELFEKHSEVLKIYQDQYRYIHIDEYQDTNIAQYKFVKLLAQRYGNIAVVGDDAQSIYSFRHADYRNILNFEKDWSNAKTIVLDENYRSTQSILDAASDIIDKNTLQKKKRLWTRSAGGELITVANLPNEHIEVDFIIKEIQKLGEEKDIRLTDIAILYRTNAQSRVLEEAFLKNNIPYTIIGGVQFYARKEIKDMLGYLRYAVNEKDELSLKRIINIPLRKIGERTYKKYIRKEPLTPSERGRISEFEETIIWLKEIIRDDGPSDILKKLIKKIGYTEYLEDNFADADVRLDNILELIGLSRRFDGENRPDGLMHLLEEIALFSESEFRQTKEKNKKEGVTMMTVHSAKGLEFPVVFIVGLEEGIFPHSRSLMDMAALEEERRLCYVGITRAKIKVYLLYTHHRTMYGGTQLSIPSRFLGEISKKLIEHHALGYGVGKEEYEEDADIEDF